MMTVASTAPQILDRLFVALADPGRRLMLERLGSGPASVSDLARPLGIALPSAMKHLAVLEAGGLVHSAKLGRVRTFSLVPEGIDALEAWVADRRRRWNTTFDRLDVYLAETAGESEHGK